MAISWDCFDTLISRHYHYPSSIFRIIAELTGDEYFVEKRKQAERICADKSLFGIYEHLSGHDPGLELQIEKEYTYPIIENFNRINNGDIVVSDMYLSSDQILEILRYHGLDKDVTVYSSYGRKADGSIWNDICTKHNIEYHIGDNLYSDIKQTRNNNLKSIYYGNSFLTPQEKLIERYSPQLAYWTKYTRLNNPYFIPYNMLVYDKGSISYYYGLVWIKEHDGDIVLLQQIDEDSNKIILYNKFDNESIVLDKQNNQITIIDEYNNRINNYIGYWIEQPINTNRFDEKILWTEQASYNIPLLINSSYLLPKNIVFSYRDCYYWKKIYDSIFDTNVDILHSCRNSYYHPYNQEYINYVLSITKDKTIVDLHGTGYSSESFFSKYNNEKQKILFISEHNGNINKNINVSSLSMCFDRIFKEDIEATKFHHNKLASKNGLRCCSGTILEKFNIPPKLGAMIGWDDKCIRKKSEHNQYICDIFDKTVDCATRVSKKYSIDGIDELTQILLKKMNETTHTNNIVHSLWTPAKVIQII